LKKIAVLTRDCAGVNAAIRSIVRTACHNNLEVVGIKRGYKGLIEGDFVNLDRRSVSGIINQGGTILKTSRSKEMFTEEGQRKAKENLQKNNIDGLVVIGGNGSLAGAHVLASKFNIPVVGVPATIDNDVNNVDLTIGADTAVNVVLDALDKIRDTATSLERIFIIEVMGRDCGYIALELALAGGCEDVIVPEMEIDIDVIIKEIKEGNSKGKVSWIIIVAEGKAHAHNIAEIITSKTGLETRVAVLGHIQRGGRPTAKDRILAARLGSYAVECLLENDSDICVTEKNEQLLKIPLSIAIKKKDVDFNRYYRLIKILT
jgi:6-phosphofructokinase 1